jgi:hypothetical protein
MEGRARHQVYSHTPASAIIGISGERSEFLNHEYFLDLAIVWKKLKLFSWIF